MNYYASVENHTPGEPILHPETTDDDEQLRLRSLLLLHQHLAAGDAENAVAALETFYACPLDTQLIDLRERYSTLKTQILLSAREAAPPVPGSAPSVVFLLRERPNQTAAGIDRCSPGRSRCRSEAAVH